MVQASATLNEVYVLKGNEVPVNGKTPMVAGVSPGASSELQWSKIQTYLSDGISIIPVRDKAAGNHQAKTPFGSWTKFQQNIIDPAELFYLMTEKYDTTAIAWVCGKVSGNLECVDVDNKYKAGIEADLFRSLSDLFPDIWNKLRVHKSPSGGYHLIYRCQEPVAGNQKLAGRMETAQEAAAAGHPKPKPINFLETRGEGGYFLAPPAMGYEVVQDRPIPVLTAQEREAILTLCKSFTEIIKEVKVVRPATRAMATQYDVNPFEDFNQRADPTQLAESLGWKFENQDSQFIRFTRPGKARGVSMSWIRKIRRFYVFTSSTSLDEHKCYTPVNFLAELQFAGDTKAVYRWLVDNGYGTYNPRAQKRLVNTLVRKGKPLPANMPEEARDQAEEMANSLAEHLPHGTFWDDNKEDGFTVNRENLHRITLELGFRIWNGEVVRVTPPFVDKMTDKDYYRIIREYVYDPDEPIAQEIRNTWNAFCERHVKWIISNFEELRPQELLRDTREVARKFYMNGILEVTAAGFQLKGYAEATGLIWRDRVLNRDFRVFEGGLYVDFLKLATGDPIPDHVQKSIGYLTHEYKDDDGYIITITETCAKPEDGGGSGKNLFCTLLGEVTTITGISGDQVQKDDRFLQSWKGERVFIISDLPKGFDMKFLKQPATGSIVVKHLYKDAREIPVEEMPKLVCQTNYSYDCSDGGLRRRVVPTEFSDVFTKAGGVDAYFKGKRFPASWTPDDWAGFDTTIARCIQAWLAGGLKIAPQKLSEGGWVKQFETTHSTNAVEFIYENIDQFVSQGFVSNAEFTRIAAEYFRATPTRMAPGMKAITDALKAYCEHHGILFNPLRLMRVGGVVCRGKYFEKEGIRQNLMNDLFAGKLVAPVSIGGEDEILPF
jgi:hypothetical protein